MNSPGDVTALLVRAGAGDRTALDAVLPLIYGELRMLAERQLRDEPAGHTLGPTALVHEAWLRVAGAAAAPAGTAGFTGRAQFFGLAATAMRRILVDHARRHRAAKRGGARVRVPLSDLQELPIEEQSGLVLELDESLTRLARLNDRQARVIECRFFAGLTEEETAEALGIGLRTVKRDWAKARAWLLAALQDAGSKTSDRESSRPVGTEDA